MGESGALVASLLRDHPVAKAHARRAAVTIGSLCSGIGGLELGLEMAGLGPVRWQVEIDERCRRVLQRHWPNAERYADICEVDTQQLEPVELVCAGFPCQDLSLAGRAAGLDGARSGVWFQCARIIGDLRPRYVVLENVNALAARGLDRVLAALASRGYDALWVPLRASDLGAPHTRERLFVVAWRLPDAERGAVWERPERLQRQGRRVRAAERIDDQLVDLGPPRDVAWPPGPADELGWERWRAEARAEPGVRRGADGTADGLDRLHALGNAVVPQVSAVVGHIIQQLRG